MRRPDPEHVVLTGDGPVARLECLHCGTVVPFPYGELAACVREMRAFARQHAGCPKPAAGDGAPEGKEAR